MTTALGDKAMAKALELIRRYGSLATLTTYVHTRDVAAGTTTATPTNTEVTITPVVGVKEQFVDGEVVKTGDSMTLIANDGLPVVPHAGARLTFAGAAMVIVKVEPLRGDERVAAWRLYLR